MKVIDARGLACPKPVIETKKALDKLGFDYLIVKVDNVPARENIKRFVTTKGYKIAKISEEDGIISIGIQIGDEKELVESKEKVSKANTKKVDNLDYQNKNIFINSNKIGSGSDELGKLLMDGFIYTLTQMDNPPLKIVFMNIGVELCAGNSATVENLKILEEKGVSMIVCGTCLEYFDMIDDLSVGVISNMYDITEIFLEPKQLVTI
ncbi:MAG: sulfurtransferase-like selenium metabolism protein YedF [Candidatus Cloacimonadota bacterium]|nr:sulfurtransferase-like selenium metabolism protein YedF [Candidatus Cloacimonadota bacterium]